MTGAELAAIRSPLTGPPDGNNNGPTPRFVGDLWWCTAAGGTFTANNLYLHDGTAWRWLSAPGTAPLTNSLASNVALNDTASYFAGPSIPQGTIGTWLAWGSVLCDGASGDQILARLWDGATVMDSGIVQLGAAGLGSIHLSGSLATPVGNLRISCRNITGVTGNIRANATGNGKDSTLTAQRAGA